MALATKDIDTFLTDQVGAGACTSTKEAEHELISTLMERGIKRGIAKGRADIQSGGFEEVNAVNNAKLINNLAKKLLLNH